MQAHTAQEYGAEASDANTHGPFQAHLIPAEQAT